MRIAVTRFSSLLMLPLCVLLIGSPTASAQLSDEVVVRGSTSGSRITIRCEIVDYDGQFLTARKPTGNNLQRIPSTDVITIRTAQTEPHKVGIKAFDEGHTRDAETHFTDAIKTEPRVWMRREILALLVRCALKRSDYLTAGTRFQLLFESDPATPHINLIPLVWTDTVAEGEIRTAAIMWLNDPEPIARLLGASLLFFDAGHSVVCQETLTELARTPGERIRQLAGWQRRRLRIRSRDVTEFDLGRWESQIEDMEPALRAGPYFVLGQGYLIRQDFDLAAATFLKVPLVHDSEHPVSAQCLLDAGRALNRIGMREEAARLYNEIIDRYGSASVVEEARGELQQLIDKK
ncbi:MAG: tetratricopeptide repeat protein [Planctomycetota bacterium]|nr:tetratricopeptide repeat protein [Planctomycetota bacterium]